MSTFKPEVMVFTNPTKHIINLSALGIDSVEPGKDVEIPLSLAAPYRMDNGQRGKSPIEQVAPQLQPKNKEDLEAWLKVPPAPIPVSKIVSVAKREVQEAPGVRALREAAQKAPVSPQSAPATPTATK
jgi:hypothetical protein